MNSSILDRSLNSSFGQDSGIAKEQLNLSSELEDGIINNDDGESLTDSSDDTSCSTWKIPPPLDSKQHRYTDEMRVSAVLSIGMCQFQLPTCAFTFKAK